MMKLNMELGEIRHIKVEIKSIKQEDFTINSGTYELKHCSDAEIEETGEINIINSRILDVVLEPKKVGEYDLKLVYQIADETLIDNVRIKVDQ